MKPVVPVHVFTGPVFSYNKTNVICHIHYFNPRNKVYIKNIYISKLRREVCSFYLANFPWLSKELLPVNGLSCLCKEKCHSIHMFHYVWSRWLHSFHKGLFFLGGGGFTLHSDLCFLYHPQMVSSVWLCAGCQQDGIDLHFPQLSYMWSHTSGAGLKPQSNIWL